MLFLSNADELRHVDIVVVEEGLQVAHQVGHQIVMRRNKRRIGEAVAANPVLATPEFARLFMFAAPITEQCQVRGPQQPRGDRQRLEVADGVVHRLDVVIDLLSVVAAFLARLVADPDFTRVARVPTPLQKVPHLRPVVLVGARGSLATALLAALRRATTDVLEADLAATRKLAQAESSLSPRAVADAYSAVAAAVARRGPEAGLLLVIDEAGKFLEYAAANPLTQDVFALQELAEAAARATTGGELWVLTVLHQNAQAYAQRLNRAQQAEWAKVAQRFRELLFFPSDVERLDIVGRALEHHPPLHLNGHLTALLDEVLTPPATLVAWVNGSALA